VFQLVIKKRRFEKNPFYQMVRSFLGEMSTEPRNRTYKASGCDGFPGTLHQIPLYLILGISL
ncbi:MAG: hypothetical protein, partial [Olavius algarvensis Gamma 1 endosymbiont]